MATRSQRYTRLLASHPYHSSISSAPCFALDATNVGGNHDTSAAFAAASPRLHDNVLGVLASPRLTDLPRGAVSASERFFVSLSRTASLAEDALWGALLVETYSSDPRAEFLESMAEMAAACGADGMPAPEYGEFMEELLACYLDRNDKAVHPHVLAAYADLAARRRPAERKRPFRELMKISRISPCVSGA